jgi:hypothetical protein
MDFRGVYIYNPHLAYICRTRDIQSKCVFQDLSLDLWQVQHWLQRHQNYWELSELPMAHTMGRVRVLQDYSYNALTMLET